MAEAVLDFTFPLIIRIPKRLLLAQFMLPRSTINYVPHLIGSEEVGEAPELQEYDFRLSFADVLDLLTYTMPANPKCNPRAAYRKDALAAKIYPTVLASPELVLGAHQGMCIAASQAFEELYGETHDDEKDDGDLCFILSDQDAHGMYNGNTTRGAMPLILKRCMAEDKRALEANLPQTAVNNFEHTFIRLHIITGIPEGPVGRAMVGDLSQVSNGQHHVNRVNQLFAATKFDPILKVLPAYRQKIECQKGEFFEDLLESWNRIHLVNVLKLLRVANPFWQYIDPYNTPEVLDKWVGALKENPPHVQGLLKGAEDILKLAEELFLNLTREKFMLDNLYSPDSKLEKTRYSDQTQAAKRTTSHNMHECKLVFTGKICRVSQANIVHTVPILRGFSEVINPAKLEQGEFEWLTDPFAIAKDKKWWRDTMEDYERVLIRDAYETRNALKPKTGLPKLCVSEMQSIVLKKLMLRQGGGFIYKDIAPKRATKRR